MNDKPKATRKLNPKPTQSAADQEQLELSRANYVSDTKRAKVTLPKVTIQQGKP